MSAVLHELAALQAFFARFLAGLQKSLQNVCTLAKSCKSTQKTLLYVPLPILQSYPRSLQKLHYVLFDSTKYRKSTAKLNECFFFISFVISFLINFIECLKCIIYHISEQESHLIGV